MAVSSADIDVEMAGPCSEGSHVRQDDRLGLDRMRPWEVLFAVSKGEWARSHLPVPVMLQSLTKALSEAAVWIGNPVGKPVGEREQAFQLFAFCKNLRNAVFLCLDDEEMATLDENRAHVFEVLCALVDFTVAFLSECGEALCLPTLRHILEALSFALDPAMLYYSKERSCGEILVLPSRLEFALRVPGCVVRVFDDGERILIAQKGVSNHKCCNAPLEMDAALVSVYWHLASSGYELLLKVLRNNALLDGFERTCGGDHGPQYALEIMALIMHPLAQVLTDPRLVLEKSDMMRSSCQAFGNVVQSLKKALLDKRDGLTPFDSIFSSRKVFMKILVHVDAVRRWSLACERDISWGDDPGELLILFLDRIDESKAAYIVIQVLGEYLDCAQGSGHEVPFVKTFLHWLKEGRVIVRFLTLKCYFQVTQLMEFAGKQGLIMKEEVLLNIINHDRDVHLDEQGTSRKSDESRASARVVAAILKNFKLDTCETETKISVCKWLQRWPLEATDSLCCVLEKLVDCDKDQQLKTRLLDIFWESASDLPANDLVRCMTKFASHYTSIAEPKPMIHSGEETENFLQVCSTVDEECSVACHHVGSNFEEKAVFELKAKTYLNMEVNFHSETTLQLRRLLDINIPLSVYETSTECLKRLELAQQSISGLETTTRSNMASVVSSTMAPELRTLEAIQKETALRPQVWQRMQDAQERHHQKYDALKRNQYISLKKFFQDCLEEKERIMRDALYAKAEVLAAVEVGKLQSKKESSPDAIRTRVFRKVESTLEEIKEEHRKSLEKQPNLECTVCLENFSAEKKRACFDPCGHTATCIDCGMKAWKGRKACPMCRCKTREPLAVPSTLFF